MGRGLGRGADVTPACPADAEDGAADERSAAVAPPVLVVLVVVARALGVDELDGAVVGSGEPDGRRVAERVGVADLDGTGAGRSHHPRVGVGRGAGAYECELVGWGCGGVWAGDAVGAGRGGAV